jgi:hypothetical protein
LFLNNNIQGYRNAKTGFLLVDKKTEEPLMCYTVGHAFFGKGAYDAEIARGCCITNYHNTGTRNSSYRTVHQNFGKLF